MNRILIMALLLMCFSAQAKDISGIVIDSTSHEGVPYATITVQYSDTVIGCFSNEVGKFKFTPRKFPLLIKAQALTMSADSLHLNSDPVNQVTLSLNSEATQLSEVTVVGKARLTSMTDNGISYKMSANQRAQSENTLQSLSYVPLVNVSPEGEISVQGSSAYSLYLNGKPYEMAQQSPKAFLESLPASSISRVEVITNPTNKYGPSASRYIINIILKGPLTDGFVMNLGASGNTQPSASGSVMGMVKKNKVDASVTYDYNLYGQRNQPWDMEYSDVNPEGGATRKWGTTSSGNGNWHTHTMRAMFKWHIDKLNILYADAHGLINNTNLTAKLYKWDDASAKESESTRFDNINKFTSGTAEANVVYRNYSKADVNAERLTLGYHFTYNPDKRHLTQKQYDTDNADTFQETDGGMTEHSGLASYLWHPARSHSFRFSAKDMYRSGNTNSTDFLSAQDGINHYSMNYHNNIAEGKVSYSGSVRRMMLGAGLTLSHDYFKMRLPQEAESNFSNRHFYAMPSASMYWMPDNANAFYLSYSTAIVRPTVSMLNPFVSTTDYSTIFKGNPLLKAQYAHDLSLNWFYNGITNLSLSLGAGYTHSNDIIQSYEYLDGNGKVISTYGNLGTSDQGQMNLNINWNANSWLTFSLNGNGGVRHLSAPAISLTQNDWFYNLTPSLNFLLPNHYRVGSSFGLYKNVPSPWTTNTALKMYSFYASKSFFKGRLDVSVTANSPFNKYHRSVNTTVLPAINIQQTNYIVARSFGIRLSYSFGSGRKVNIERDQTLKSDDQSTGVN